MSHLRWKQSKRSPENLAVTPIGSETHMNLVDCVDQFILERIEHAFAQIKIKEEGEEEDEEDVEDVEEEEEDDEEDEDEEDDDDEEEVKKEEGMKWEEKRKQGRSSQRLQDLGKTTKMAGLLGKTRRGNESARNSSRRKKSLSKAALV